MPTPPYMGQNEISKYLENQKVLVKMENVFTNSTKTNTKYKNQNWRCWVQVGKTLTV